MFESDLFRRNFKIYLYNTESNQKLEVSCTYSLINCQKYIFYSLNL